MASISDPLVKANDVTLIPVLDLPESMRNQFEYEAGDYAIARDQSRANGKIINADTAALINAFSQPVSIAEAVIRFSAERQVDPYETLEQAFPLIQQFVNSRILVLESQNDVAAESQPLQYGDTIGRFTITHLVQQLEDTAIYQATDDDGHVVAIKQQAEHTSAAVTRLLQHEATILNALDGVTTPELMAIDVADDRAFLAMAWCDGVDALTAAGELRDDRPQLLHLLRSVVAAYADIHRQGIVHGDVHPGNILIDGTGQTRLIDFGLAHKISAGEALRAAYRGGVAFYFDPQYAQSVRDQTPPPSADFYSEQYAVAALLYEMCTGAHYLNFSLEHAELYRQIVEETPLPFAAHGVAAWPEVERILSRALRKEPSDRFADMADMLAALDAIDNLPTTNKVPELTPESAEFIGEVLDTYRPDGDLYQHGLPRAPLASVKYGAAGIAYFLYRVASSQGDPELLALADLWATRAAALTQRDDAFFNAEIDISAETVGHIAPLHSASGIAVVQALIAAAMGYTNGVLEATAAFVYCANRDCDKLDLTLGKASVILGAAQLVPLLENHELAEKTGLIMLGDNLTAQLWAEIKHYRPIGVDSELTNLGIAHGWAGLLYAIMRWSLATQTPLPDGLRDRLDQLAGLAQPAGRGVRWPWQLDQPTGHMPGWCNGTTGYVYLWTLAHALFEDARYLDLALKSGWQAWEDDAQIANLCCGLAGRAYALLHLYKVTDDAHWLKKAMHSAEIARRNIRLAQPDEYRGFEHSLYKGETGVALLLADLTQPDQAVFPFFEAEFS